MIAELRHETQTVSVSEAESVSGSDSESEALNPRYSTIMISGGMQQSKHI